MDRQKEVLYSIALSLIPSIGHITYHQLMKIFGNAEIILNGTKDFLLSKALKPTLVENIIKNRNSVLALAEKELDFVEKNNVQILLFSDDNYPYRLKQCVDAPPFLFGQGNFQTNPQFCIAIVGTRKSTDYGNKVVQEIVEGLSSNPHIQVISGLAIGIDTVAHQSAIDQNLETIAILGSSLKNIYPSSNKGLAKKMMEKGGIFTEFFSTFHDDAGNFARRNRIIAGMADAILVAEAPSESGAIMTANFGFSYNRDVFAVPGRYNDKNQKGCNDLIYKDIAKITTSAENILEAMNWDCLSSKIQKTQKIPLNNIQLDENERKIVNHLQKNENMNIDELSIATEMNISILTQTLLSLEFEGILECLPGKRYKLLKNI